MCPLEHLVESETICCTFCCVNILNGRCSFSASSFWGLQCDILIYCDILSVAVSNRETNIFVGWVWTLIISCTVYDFNQTQNEDCLFPVCGLGANNVRSSLKACSTQQSTNEICSLQHELTVYFNVCDWKKIQLRNKRMSIVACYLVAYSVLCKLQR